MARQWLYEECNDVVYENSSVCSGGFDHSLKIFPFIPFSSVYLLNLITTLPFWYLEIHV